LNSSFMKIAIDAHSLGTQAGGNETYYRQLIRGLAQDASRNHYTLFHTHPFTLDEIENDPRFALRKTAKNPVVRLTAALPAALREIQPDIFHCQYVQPLWGNGRTVVAIHDLAHEHFPEFFHPLEALRMKKLVRWTAKKAQHILTISQFSAADIAERFSLPRNKITVAYLSASPDFHPRDKQFCQDHLARAYGIRSPFILYIGRIQARKNLPRLVEAFACVRKKGADLQLVIVGKKDWQSEMLAARVSELGLESTVIFPGFVPFNDLPLFYNAAELFVFPSFFEGFGLPVIESMASGVPTITSFGSSLQEIAGDGALLINPAETDSIAAAMDKILGDRDLRERLAAAGIQRAKQFTQDQLVKNTLAVYRLVA
ncbi:MAG TPA: glycosyltransferase family 1 protein, partial [Candidatus Sulfotelmatobacter sp.]|nr:glycosyltransferase family 1 protein [Candidatus Sulfotelmatobacter sp.]